MKEKESRRLPTSVSAAVFVTDDEGKLLLLKQRAKRKGGKWGPPAGGMNAHETPLDAAKREAKEEIGVDVRLINLIGIYTMDRGDDATGMAFVFRGEINMGEIELGEEITNYKYFSPQEIRELIKKDMIYKPEYSRLCIADWLKNSSYPLEVIKELS